MQKLIYRLFRFRHNVERSLSRRFTPRGLAVLCGFVCSALIGIDTNRSLAYKVFTLLASLLAVAIAASQLFRFRFQATRNLPRFGTVGQPLRYKILLQNQTPKVQTGLQLIEEIPDVYPSFPEFLRQFVSYQKQHRGKGLTRAYDHWLWYVSQQRRAIANAVNLPLLPPNRQTEVTVEIIPLQRGLLRLTGITVACPDPLGLAKACRTVALPQSILILPQLYQVPPISLPGLRRYQSGGVALTSSVGDSEEFRALREYRLGDSPRKIHWKSWAKVGQPIVKEEQDEYFVRHALLLDTFTDKNDDTPIDRDPIDRELFEAAVSVAASFAYEVQTQESLLDLMFVGLETYCFTVGRGLGQTRRMLEILASVVPCQEQSFDALIPVVMNRLSLLSGCICVFLTWDASRKALIQHLEQRQIPTLVLLVAPDHTELDIPSNVRILRVGHIQAGLRSL
jgi:uncharacterized protein (DUF58 family)